MAILKIIGVLSVGLILSLAVLTRLGEFKALRSLHGRFARFVLIALASLMISFAGAKHGGTNDVDQTGGATTNEPPMAMVSHPLGRPAPPSVPELPGEITSDALDIGLVLVGVGTNESHDFDAPASAAIVTNWLARGAASDWIRCSVNEFDSLMVLAGGVAYPLVSNRDGRPSLDHGSSFSVLHSPFGHGVVPVSNWGLLDQANRPCRVWYGSADDGAFAVTWQNVLLGCDPASPVSFQLRLLPDGTVEYRYDLSRLADDSALVGMTVAVANGVAVYAPTPIGRNLTSLTFARLTEADRDNPDRDGDGLSTADELFVHHTDPSLPDSDFDGLSDFDELMVHHTDPLDPNSLRPDIPDGMAVVMGSEDPFAVPEGSANTVFEHVFYTGTTNAPFAYPSDTDDTAVLRVTVRGSGAGRLVIGDRVVPLLARPSRRLLMGAKAGGAPDPTEQTVYVHLAKGIRYGFWGSLPTSLQVEVDSGSYAVGRLPRWYTGGRGWLAFPRTKAKEPCIHDLGARTVEVSLDPGSEIEGLTCTWNEAADIEVESLPPLAARLTGRFPRNSTMPVTYTLAHPDYLFGASNLVQTARFCPAVSDEDDEDLWSSRDSEYGDREEHGCRCGEGFCCEKSWCDCGYYCCDDDDDDDEDASGDCPVHGCPYEQCERLHFAAYTNALARARDPAVLHLDRSPEERKEIAVEVPGAFARCCPCPEHWTNYVALAAKSYNLAVRTADGERFTSTDEDRSIYVSGLAPSRDFNDSVVSLCRTGEVYETHRYTVLGLDIRHPSLDLNRIVRLNPEIGFPIAASTSLALGTGLLLCTDVDLNDGEIRLEVSGSTTNRFQLYLGDEWSQPELLLDTEGRSEMTCSLATWRRMTRAYTSDRETQITIVAFGEGTVRLDFSYAAEHDGRSLSDSRELLITAILPPLVPDFDRDGDFDDDDARLCVSNRFEFWTNRDRWRGDDAFGESWIAHITGWSSEPNGADDVVNGRNDLVNLLPLAIRTGVFARMWPGHRIGVEIRSQCGVNILRRCYADIPWNASKRSVLEDVTVDDESAWWHIGYDCTLHSAKLRFIGYGGDALSEGVLARAAQERGVVLVEARGGCDNALGLGVTVDGEEVFSCALGICFSDVDTLYDWHNIRGGAVDVGSGGAGASRADAAHIFFVHGYNVSEVEAREWGRAMFKRLWWAGSTARFHVVTWFGNDSQRNVPGVGLFSPDYQVNVEHAFASASNLVAVAVPFNGRKYFIAHSLGNMLVSSAIQDWGLPHDKYMLLNAAVPIEAYDTSDNAVNATTINRMTPREWVGYDASLKAANWHTFFDTGDGRRKLTWKGRFSRVVNVVNYYSSEEEVLRCGHGEWHQPLQRVYAWYNQERIKGVKPFEAGLGRNEGGWGFNAAYYVEDEETAGTAVPYVRPRHADEANALVGVASVDFRSTPFFGWFADRTICTNAFLVESSVSLDLQSQLLADAIPAESLPAGLSAVPCWNGDSSTARNVDMAAQLKDSSRLNLVDEDLREWGHSYFLSAPYMIVHPLFENINLQLKGGL